MTDNKDSGKLETFAILEVMGHSKFAGFVQQVAMGGSAMIRIDVPEIPESEEEYTDWEYGADARGIPVKKKRKVPGQVAFTKFFGISSIFSITPCSEEVALAAVKQFRSAPVTVLQMPSSRPLLTHEASEVSPSGECDEDRDY